MRSAQQRYSIYSFAVQSIFYLRIETPSEFWQAFCYILININLDTINYAC